MVKVGRGPVAVLKMMQTAKAMLLLVCAASYLVNAATTNAPSGPSLAPTRAPTDDKVGTALAPTTPGGLCLNEEDYGKWTSTVSGTEMTGFDYFPLDLEKCSVYCVNLGGLTPNQGNDIYECGQLLQTNKCDPLLQAICVRDCMSRTGKIMENDAANVPALTVFPYTIPCASCMGNLSYCGATKCTASCLQGASGHIDCRECNVDKCNPDFMLCAGLNPQLKNPATLDIVPVLIGAVAGGLALLALVIALGAYQRSKTRKLKMFSPEELAILAGSQSMALSPTSGNVPIGSMNMSQISSTKLDDKNASNPLYRSPASVASSSFSNGDNLTPYQQQYLAQQAALAGGGTEPGQSRVAPSVRASQMVKRAISAPPSITATATNLVVTFEFVAEREDELNAKVGDKMIGIEQQDGWWLAQDSKGVMGLIPVAYTAVDASGPQPTNSKIDPDF